MPWKECSVTDERLRFVAQLLDGETMSEVCRAFGISRKTGYKIFEASGGLLGSAHESAHPRNEACAKRAGADSSLGVSYHLIALSSYPDRAGGSVMPVDLFLKLAGIDGESTDAKHKGEIDVLAWSWGLSQDRGPAPPAGGGRFKNSVISLSLSRSG
jgi:hypothetical protein